MTRKQLNNQLCYIMRYAHKLYRGGISIFSEALRVIRSRLFRQHTRVRGTSFHQGALEVLASIRTPNSYKLTVHEEPQNRYDSSALSIYAEVSISNKRYNHLYKDGHTFKEGGLSPKTVNRVHVLIGGALN